MSPERDDALVSLPEMVSAGAVRCFRRQNCVAMPGRTARKATGLSAMERWRRVAVGSALALAAAAAAAAIAIHVLVDPEHVKSLAREKARAAWGRDLAIAEISIRLLPAPA